MSIAVRDHYANQNTDVDELIKTHSDLVRKIAWQVYGRTRHTTEIEDIMQIGFTGLVNAAQKYTRKEGATFATYASIRIKGAIIDYLRKSSNLCRTTIQIKKKYNKAVSPAKAVENRRRHPAARCGLLSQIADICRSLGGNRPTLLHTQTYLIFTRFHRPASNGCEAVVYA